MANGSPWGSAGVGPGQGPGTVGSTGKVRGSGS